jgi:hypothetical protein
MGFSCTPSDLNRFNSRYRLAKSFRGIALETYTRETTEGYAALFHVFLTYSALEQFMRCCGITLSDTKNCLTAYDAADCAAAIRKVKGHEKFLQAVLAQLDRDSFRKEYNAFLGARPANLLYLAAGIRHIFAHGRLTPNTGAGTVDAAKEVSELLISLLLRLMDSEFSRRLRTNGITP